ncbi:hypothetical protein [Algoriphagus mannitolivorans]|uniref:hypothetical protein n=1 Tax=Algoriphagus mannitolivorans TaxID=226504 RepID=UPI00055460E0|nr:hypothetical protein [Algoriphagus mannitolivorans]
MKGILRIALFFLFVIVSVACEESTENPNLDFQLDFQPLELGNFWVYRVEETLYFGENDSESSTYFIRDRVRSSFVNEANELVYIVERQKSPNQNSWITLKDYTMFLRNNTLIRSIDNQALVALVFPPSLGKTWNGKIYQAGEKDDFEIEVFENNRLKVKQEDLDDKVTVRDKRYEFFERGVGLIEKYDEVVTYCSRTDCLGNQLIDGGYKVSLTLVNHGKR